MMKPFRERNPLTIGAISIAVILVMLVGSMKASDLPLIGGGDTYYANFSDASGLRPDDEVRVAGVRVGKVTAVDLDGDHVRVTFKIKKHAAFGTETGAQIKVKTLLGQMFLALDPEGGSQLKAGSTIPASRTRSAYDVVQAFSGLASHVEQINVPQLSKSFDVLADATKNTPASFQETLRGLSRLSQNVAARDAQLNTLLGNLSRVSKILDQHSGDVVALMKDGGILLRALVARRQSIHALLVAASKLSTQLTGLVQESRADLHPTLVNLQSVVDLLRKNQSNLDLSLREMAPFYRVFNNALGNGPWWDVWISNLPPLPRTGQ